MFGQLFGQRPGAPAGRAGGFGGATGGAAPGDKFEPAKIELTKDNEKLSKGDRCFPVTMKMLENAPKDPESQDKLLIHGKSVTQILCVVQILSIVKKEIQYEISATDSTSTLPFKFYYAREDEKVQSIFDAFHEGSWIRVVGTGRRLAGGTVVSVQFAEQVTDAFEPSSHLAESISVALKTVRGITSVDDEPTAASAGAGGSAAAGNTTTIKSERMSVDQGASASSSSAAPASVDVEMGAADLVKELKAFLKTHGEPGASSAMFVAKFPQFSKADADKVLEDMEEAGDIFNGAEDGSWCLVE